jgi:hypothetical protein
MPEYFWFGILGGVMAVTVLYLVVVKIFDRLGT